MKSRKDRLIELEATLKLYREENRLLRRDLDALTSSSHERPLPKNKADQQELGKMKSAFRALKNLLVSQERIISDLKTKEVANRKRIKEQDSKIDMATKPLELQVDALTQEFNEKTNFIESLQARVKVYESFHGDEKTNSTNKDSIKRGGGNGEKDLSMLRRKKSESNLENNDRKSVVSKRTVSTASTVESSPSISYDRIRHITRNKHEKSPGRHRKSPGRGRVSRSSSYQDPCVRARSKTPTERRRKVIRSQSLDGGELVGYLGGAVRKRSDLSMIRKASREGDDEDCDTRSVSSRRSTATSRSRYSVGSGDNKNRGAGMTIEEYQAMKIRETGKKKPPTGFHDSVGPMDTTVSWNSYEEEESPKNASQSPSQPLELPVCHIFDDSDNSSSESTNFW